MSKLVILLLCFLALALAARADDVSSSGRHLLQGLYNCGGVKQLDGPNRCCQACWCVGEQSDKKALAIDNVQKFCREQCQKCVAAAKDTKQCPKDSSPLPDICAKGLQFSPTLKSLIDTCIAMWQKDPKFINQAKC